MTMPPREALVPLLKLAGTAAVMAAAYSFGSKAVVAAAYKQHGRPSHTASARKKSDAELSEQKESEEIAAAATVADTVSAPPATMPRSSLAVAMLLQDGYLVRRLHSSSPPLYTS